MWNESSSEARAAMSDLDALVDEIVAKFEGMRPLEQGEGDSFVAGFARASDALACALEIQRRLIEEPLFVRMGLHTGEIEVREDRYDGPTIIRAARLRDIGHGGQTLASAPTRDLVQDVLPDGADLIDLGSHRLKGLDRAERVYQLVHPALPNRFPPLRSTEAAKGNLPVRLTSFVGRTTELANVTGLVNGNRLVTLTGAGGCGKTRLAIEAAARLDESFPDGVWFCDLGPLSDPDIVPQTLRTTIGLREETSRSDLETVCVRLSDAKTLVVLDNCEHVVAASADLAEAVLKACPKAHVLTTSREPLGVEGEVAWRVPSLPAPSSRDSNSPEDLARFDAVRLFVERAGQARPSFALTSENAPSVAEICARLDGIPLAIELAAARTRVLSVEDLATGLSDRFRLLGRGSRAVLARQQTLEASVGWSHDMLSPTQKTALRRLAAFAGSFTLEGAEHVVASDDITGAEVLELLSQLVDRSLLVAEETTEGTRYRLLETIRQYARERLVDSGEAPAVAVRHLGFYADWMQRLVERAEAGEIQAADASRAVDAAYDNIREACEWAIADGQHELGLCLVSSLGDLWFVWFGLSSDTRSRQGLSWLRQLLRAAADVNPQTHARALLCLTQLTIWNGTLFEAAATANEALPFVRDVGDPRLVSRILLAAGFTLGTVDAEGGRSHLQEAAQIAREHGDTSTLWQALYYTGQISVFGGTREIEAAREGLAVARKGDLTADPLRFGLGVGLIQAGEMPEARRQLEAALAGFEALDQPTWASRVKVFLALANFLVGDRAAARELAQEAVTLAEADAPEREFATLIARFFLAWIAAEEGRHDDAHADLARLGSHDFVTLWAGLGWSMRSFIRASRGDDVGAREALEAVAETPVPIMSLVRIIACWMCALVARHLDELSDAESHVHEAFAVIADDGPRVFAPDLLDVAAALRMDVGADIDAGRLYGAANAARAVMGTKRRTHALSDTGSEIDTLRDRLGEMGFAEALHAGEALSLDDAVAYAQRGRGPRQRPPSGWDSVTPTELKVVALVAEGLTNPQIGERLFISKRTVSAHLRNVFGKLGVSTRAVLAAEATRRSV
jgi:predicted ATPase/DNA-binding CsgD family transcriptional regulator